MPNNLELLTETIHRRQLTTPLLLLLASHRPLTFITGQFFYALAPLGLLLGWEGINEWAALLSAPDANQRLTTLLASAPATSSKPSSNQTSTQEAVQD
jgi:hypothetical protein